MINMIGALYDAYNRIMDNGDERVNKYPLMSGPMATVAICVSYVLFVKYIGPRLMRQRRPFELRAAMIAYNFFMVVASAYIVYVFSRYAWFRDYSFRCQPVDYSYEPIPLKIVQTCYVYYILKYLEFFDTIFFVLRKKFTHISTLHVIHHGIMPFSVWWGMKFVPGGHASFFGTLNSFVHVIMYTYYGIAAFGPQMYKYLWWKKYLTTLQMIQFILIFVHAMQLFFYTDCNFPKIFGVWIGMHGVLFWFLFSHFYKRTYSKNQHTITNIGNGKPLADRVHNRTHMLLKYASLCSHNMTNLMQPHDNDDESTFNNNNNNNNNNVINGKLCEQKNHTPDTSTTYFNGYADIRYRSKND